MSYGNPYGHQLVPSNSGNGPTVSCPACTFSNPIAASRCSVCNTPLDIQRAPPAYGGPPPAYGNPYQQQGMGSPIVPSHGTPIVPGGAGQQGVVYIDADTGQRVYVPAGQVVVVQQRRDNDDGWCVCCGAMAAMLACCCIADSI